MGGATYAQASAYPNLAGVPSEAPRPTSDNLRDTLIKGLVADRENARYTDEILTSESTAVPPAPSPPKGKQRVDIPWETPRVVPEWQDRQMPEHLHVRRAGPRVGRAEPVGEQHHAVVSTVVHDRGRDRAVAAVGDRAVRLGTVEARAPHRRRGREQRSRTGPPDRGREENNCTGHRRGTPGRAGGPEQHRQGEHQRGQHEDVGAQNTRLKLQTSIFSFRG